MASRIMPFVLAVPETDLEDLRERLARTRWPEKETVDDWSQGVPLANLQALVEYWRTTYDWRRCEAMLNGWGQYRFEVDGLRIHFLHIRSPYEHALPLLMTHGWPGSVIEFHKVILPLTDPVACGGKAEDAFHLVLPSLPGYGFSDRPRDRGWDVERIARAWAELMDSLGYRRYVAQGGDWGAAVTTALARLAPPQLVGIHLTQPFVVPSGGGGGTPEEERALQQLKRFNTRGSAYAMQQATRPQTLGYGLVDSPVGQAAWIYEKFYEWTDHDGSPESVLTRDELLDNIMLYWLPGTAASSARLYWESYPAAMKAMRIDVPVGCSLFPKDILRPPRIWAEQAYSKLFYWNELPCGGHFAALEQPELFVAELRACFAKLR